MSKISLFLIDDHNLFSQGVASLVAGENQIDWLGYTPDPDLGKEIVARLHPNIVLLDYFIPGKNGIELGKEILKLSPATKLVLLTMEKTFLVVEKAKIAGFFGFIPKDTERESMINTLMEVSKGMKVFPDVNQNKIEDNSTMVKLNQLSKREKEIALLVVQGYSSMEISEKLFLSLFTIHTHRRNLFQKLGLKNVAQLSDLFNKMG